MNGSISKKYIYGYLFDVMIMVKVLKFPTHRFHESAT